ncbi:MAG: hypothetical protein V4675_10930, partial [Verrucomicrobiota bacterium]
MPITKYGARFSTDDPIASRGDGSPRMARILRMARMDGEFEQKVTKDAGRTRLYGCGPACASRLEVQH